MAVDVVNGWQMWDNCTLKDEQSSGSKERREIDRDDRSSCDEW